MKILSWLMPKRNIAVKPVNGTEKRLEQKEKQIENVKNDAQEKLTKIAREMKNKHLADEKYFRKTIQEIHDVADNIAFSAGRMSQ